MVGRGTLCRGDARGAAKREETFWGNAQPPRRRVVVGSGVGDDDRHRHHDHDGGRVDECRQ